MRSATIARHFRRDDWALRLTAERARGYLLTVHRARPFFHAAI
jgi:hypothetical protein